MAMYLVALLLLSVTVQDRYLISYERSGGFAGITTSINIDTDTLQADEKEQLFQLIEEADFFDLVVENDSTQGSADRFMHIIRIQADDLDRKLELGDAAIPDHLLPLISYLSHKARSSP